MESLQGQRPNSLSGLEHPHCRELLVVFSEMSPVSAHETSLAPAGAGAEPEGHSAPSESLTLWACH